LVQAPSGRSSELATGQAIRPLARRRRQLQVVFLLAALVLSGCSVRKIAYNFANRFLVTKLVDTFDLDRAQKKQAQAAVTAIHKWHRSSELPQYVQFLDQLCEKLGDGLSRDEVLWMLQQGEGAFERVARRIAPDMAALLVSLTPAQVAHSQSELQKGSQERFERLEAPEQEYVNFRLKRARKNMTTWMGSYTDGQISDFERFIRENRPEELRRQKDNEQSRQILVAALTDHASAAAIETLLLNWMTKQQARPTDAVQRAEERNRDDFVDLVLNIDRSLSPAQRQHLLKELRTLRTELYELSIGQ
jgi:hypothetical protein